MDTPRDTNKTLCSIDDWGYVCVHPDGCGRQSFDAGNRCLAHIVDPIFGSGRFGVSDRSPRFGKIVKTSFPLLQLARSVFLMCATMCFFWGISNIGLAEATAIMDISPVLITLGAVLFLGERIGIRRVIGIIGALIGAMIVIRPGSDVFSVYALFPLGAAICYSGYNIITRFVGAREDPWTSLFYTALFGAIVFSTIVPFHWQPLSMFTITLMAALSVMALLAQWLLIKALSLGEASLLAPIGYIALIFATLWGFLLFGDLPDQWTVIGALVIVASGVYVWSRERNAG